MDAVQDLYSAHDAAPWPAGLREDAEVAGVALVLVDADVAGLAQAYLARRGHLRPDQWVTVRACAADLRDVLPQLTGEAWVYFGRLFTLAQAMLRAADAGADEPRDEPGDESRAATAAVADALLAVDARLADARRAGRAVRYALEGDATALTREEVEAWLVGAEAEGVAHIRYRVELRGEGAVLVSMAAVEPPGAW
jgi:hypothetical protein